MKNLFARAKLENDMLHLGLDDVFKEESSLPEGALIKTEDQQ
jgi:hypothetical protein